MAIMLRKGSSMVTDWGLFFSIPNTNKGVENVNFYHDGKAILFHRFNGTNNPNIGKNLAFIVCEKNGEYEDLQFDFIGLPLSVASSTDDLDNQKSSPLILPTGDSVITEHGFYILNKDNKLFIWRDNGTDSPTVGKNKVLELGLNLVGSEDEFLAQFHDFEAEEELKAKHMGVLEWVVLIAFTCYMIWLGFFKAW